LRKLRTKPRPVNYQSIAVIREGAAFALADFFQQFDLDLLNLKESVVLLWQEVIDFLVQVPNLELGFEVDLVIVLRPQSITGFRPVLTHHDDGRLQRSQAGEDEIQ